MGDPATLNLDLAYGLKEGEEVQFADAAELDEANRRVASALDAARAEARARRGAFDAARAEVVARAAREAYFAPLRATWGPRVSSYLLREAVARKYASGMPRPKSGVMRPGRWWGEILETLDRRPPALALDAVRLAWLVSEIWGDQAVQDGWAAPLQRWVNVLDAEMVAHADGRG